MYINLSQRLVIDDRRLGHPWGRVNGSEMGYRERLLALFPPPPRWHWVRIGPQPYSGRSCSRFQFFKDRIPQRILPVPPAPALLDQRVIDVGAIGQEHIGNRAVYTSACRRVDASPHLTLNL
jgi:hypothetical protein